MPYHGLTACWDPIHHFGHDNGAINPLFPTTTHELMEPQLLPGSSLITAYLPWQDLLPIHLNLDKANHPSGYGLWPGKSTIPPPIPVFWNWCYMCWNPFALNSRGVDTPPTDPTAPSSSVVMDKTTPLIWSEEI